MHLTLETVTATPENDFLRSRILCHAVPVTADTTLQQAVDCARFDMLQGSAWDLSDIEPPSDSEIIAACEAFRPWDRESTVAEQGWQFEGERWLWFSIDLEPEPAREDQPEQPKRTMRHPHSREPLTAYEASQNVETMKRETAIDAQSKVLQMALGNHGNLTDGARKVYADRLAELQIVA